MIKLLASLFLLNSANAAIVGSDDRHEIITSPSHIQDISKSIAALVPKKNVTKTDNGYILNGTDYVKKMGFCPDARFVRKQRLVANCSASLIGKSKILTAGHCIDETGRNSISNYYVVFDYKVNQNGEVNNELRKDQVFEISSIKQRDFNFPGDKDVAILNLNREVKDRKVLKVDTNRVKLGQEIFMIGFPLGLPMKYHDNGFVTSLKSTIGGKDSFVHNLDSFSVNSGSSIFSADTFEIVGILVRGAGPNYEKRADEDCQDWGGLVKKSDYFAEGNYTDLLGL